MAAVTLTYTEVAEMTGLTVESLYEYQRRGTMPAPDGYLGRTPWWRLSTIQRWNRIRRRRGVVATR